MKLAYLLKAHKNPAQVRRLMSRLATKESCFLLTIDRNSDFRAFKRELAKLPSDVPYYWIVPRQDGTWCGPGLVLSSLSALEFALQMDEVPDHIYQISGQCYPIKPVRQIVAYFEALGDRCVMECIPPPVASWPDGGRFRIDKYHWHTPRWLPFDKGWREYPGDDSGNTLKSRALNAILKWKFPLPRKGPSCITDYFGHAFWSMTPQAAEYVLRFHRQHPEVFRHHKYTFVLDEYFVQSIIGSSSTWRSKVTGTHLQYCDWTKPIRPAVLTMDDRNVLQETEYLMARKFDETTNPEILNWIDAHLLERG